jgi:hypothetical protein
MKKIPSLFVRDPENMARVSREVHPDCQWVIDGEGVPTRKLDGTCCLVRSGKLYRRYTLRKGKTAPEHFEPATDVDPNTGKQEGWIPVGDGPQDAIHREARDEPWHDGTYELVGPKVQGNPEGYLAPRLIRHGSIGCFRDGGYGEVPRDFDGLKAWFVGRDIEGVVWHHPDGRMAKIKGSDFGVKRGD